MLIQKKYCTLLFLSISTLSYGMDNFFADEEKKKVHPLIQCVLYTCSQMEKLAKEMKKEAEKNKKVLEADKVYVASDGRFRTVRTCGPIIVVERVQPKSDEWKAKL